MFEGGKSISSIVAGLVVLFLGAVPLLNQIGAISWTIPPIPKIILQIILAGSGFYLVVDGFFELGMHPGIAWFSILFGLTTCILGILALLSDIGQFAIQFAFMTSTFIYVLYVLIGFLLILGAFMF